MNSPSEIKTRLDGIVKELVSTKYYGADQHMLWLISTCESLLAELEIEKRLTSDAIEATRKMGDRVASLEKELEQLRVDTFPESRWREKYYDKCAELVEVVGAKQILVNEAGYSHIANDVNAENTGDDVKPREFWIYDNGEYFGSMVSTEPIDEEDKKTDFRHPEEIVHVIEYSAYDKLRAELEESKLNYEGALSDSDNYKQERDALLANKQVDEDIKNAYLECIEKMEQVQNKLSAELAHFKEGHTHEVFLEHHVDIEEQNVKLQNDLARINENLSVAIETLTHIMQSECDYPNGEEDSHASWSREALAKIKE